MSPKREILINIKKNLEILAALSKKNLNRKKCYQCHQYEGGVFAEKNKQYTFLLVFFLFPACMHKKQSGPYILKSISILSQGKFIRKSEILCHFTKKP